MSWHRSGSIALSAALFAWLVLFGGVGHAQQACFKSSNGAYDLDKANWHLDAAGFHLGTCAYADGGPWDACQRAYAEMSYADVNLAQIFLDAFPSGKRCWRCDPRFLISVAERLAGLNQSYVRQSSQRASFDHTAFNIRSWADYPLCPPGKIVPSWGWNGNPAWGSKYNFRADGYHGFPGSDIWEDSNGTFWERSQSGVWRLVEVIFGTRNDSLFGRPAWEHSKLVVKQNEDAPDAPAADQVHDGWIIPR